MPAKRDQNLRRGDSSKADNSKPTIKSTSGRPLLKPKGTAKALRPQPPNHPPPEPHLQHINMEMVRCAQIPVYVDGGRLFSSDGALWLERFSDWTEPRRMPTPRPKAAMEKPTAPPPKASAPKPLARAITPRGSVLLVPKSKVPPATKRMPLKKAGAKAKPQECRTVDAQVEQTDGGAMDGATGGTQMGLAHGDAPKDDDAQREDASGCARVELDPLWQCERAQMAAQMEQMASGTGEHNISEASDSQSDTVGGVTEDPYGGMAEQTCNA